MNGSLNGGWLKLRRELKLPGPSLKVRNTSIHSDTLGYDFRQEKNEKFSKRTILPDGSTVFFCRGWLGLKIVRPLASRKLYLQRFNNMQAWWPNPENRPTRWTNPVLCQNKNDSILVLLLGRRHRPRPSILPRVSNTRPTNALYAALRWFCASKTATVSGRKSTMLNLFTLGMERLSGAAVNTRAHIVVERAPPSRRTVRSAERRWWQGDGKRTASRSGDAPIIRIVTGRGLPFLINDNLLAVDCIRLVSFCRNNQSF